MRCKIWDEELMIEDVPVLSTWRNAWQIGSSPSDKPGGKWGPISKHDKDPSMFQVELWIPTPTRGDIYIWMSGSENRTQWIDLKWHVDIDYDECPNFFYWLIVCCLSPVREHLCHMEMSQLTTKGCIYFYGL